MRERICTEYNSTKPQWKVYHIIHKYCFSYSQLASTSVSAGQQLNSMHATATHMYKRDARPLACSIPDDKEEQ